MAAGQVNSIRVQDLTTGKWYNYDNRGWDANGSPKIAIGKEKVYVAFWATNYSDAGNLTLQIIDADTGKVVAENKVYAQPWYGDINKGVGIECTTNATAEFKGKRGLDMPGHPWHVLCKVTP